MMVGQQVRSVYQQDLDCQMTLGRVSVHDLVTTAPTYQNMLRLNLRYLALDPFVTFIVFERSLGF